MKHSKELEKIIHTDVDAGEVVKVCYSKSGDMNGSFTYAEFDFKKKIFHIEKAASHDVPIITKEYQVVEEDFNRIQDYIQEYNFCAWSLVPQEDIFADDGPTITLSFVCQKEDSFSSFSLKQFLKLPEDGLKAYRVFLNLFFSLEKQENLIRIFEEESETDSDDK